VAPSWEAIHEGKNGPVTSGSEKEGIRWWRKSNGMDYENRSKVKCREMRREESGNTSAPRTDVLLEGGNRSQKTWRKKGLVNGATTWSWGEKMRKQRQ